MHLPRVGPATVLAVAAAAGVVVLAAPVGAAPSTPAPTPAPTPAASSHGPLLSINLPGVLSVEVPQLPDILGGGQRAATTPASPTAVPSAPASSAPVPTKRTASRDVVERRVPPPIVRTTAPRARTQPSLPANARPADTIVVPTRAAAPARTATRSATAQRPSAVDTIFRRSVIPGVPTWLLLLVLAGCLAGTTYVVRAAGHRPVAQRASGRHRD